LTCIRVVDTNVSQAILGAVVAVVLW